MVRPNVLAVVSIAWLGLSAASSPQGAENVLSRIPEGACGAAVLNRLFQTDAKIQGLASQVRIEGASPLSSLKGWLGVQQGLDEQGSALLVLMPVGDRKTPPAAIFFLPVTDYQQFLRALSPQDAARITTVKGSVLREAGEEIDSFAAGPAPRSGSSGAGYPAAKRLSP